MSEVNVGGGGGGCQSTIIGMKYNAITIIGMIIGMEYGVIMIKISGLYLWCAVNIGPTL